MRGARDCLLTEHREREGRASEAEQFRALRGAPDQDAIASARTR